jgi:hypothetical protein
LNRPQPIREGFVDPAGAPEQTTPALRAAPAPTIEPSPAETDAAAAAAAELDKWPITVKLMHRAIRNNNGQEVREVSLREPRAGDINRYGNPIRINQDGDVLIDERKMTFMISALADILPPFIEQMDTRDWNSVAYRLRRFFLPDPAGW